MEETDNESRTASPDIPKIPIKTYRWEDVRRSRKRGAYPWTHLTKPPYGEEVHPEEYTMDAFRRSRSTSTLGKSETHEINDIMEEFESDTKMDDSENQQLKDRKNEYTDNMQSSTSKKEFNTIPRKPSNGNKDRAKSEEPVKKRKLSVDSSHSRISLPKLKLQEKLKNAKARLKVPKFPKQSRPNLTEAQDVKKLKVATTKNKTKLQAPLKDNSPVYIHIPLKPPPGQTDEFSKYEFESPSHSPAGSVNNINEISVKKRKPSLLDILTQIKLVHDEHIARRSSQPSEELKKTIKLKPDGENENEDVFIQEISTEDQCSTKGDDQQPIVETEESGSTTHTNIDRSFKNDKLTIQEIVIEEVKPKTPNPVTMEIDNNSVDDNISQYLDKEDQYEIIPEKLNNDHVAQCTTAKQEDFTPDPDKLRKLEGAMSKWKRQIPKITNLDLPPSLPVRAKSEEPKIKRKSSIDSSYSRKSLSKLAFLKKLKQAKEKIKLPKFPSFSKSDKKESSKVKETKIQLKSVQTVKKPTQPEKPIYIHIPLKPLPGEIDEFSYLVNESVVENVPQEIKPETKDEELETPEPDSKHNVQLIILTPPSDDEILDSAGPETPSESDHKFFENLKIEDLKTLAKNAVNTVYPDVKTLETVQEDEDSDTQNGLKITEEEHEDVPTEVPRRQILVDEEDGLKLSEAAVAMINEELEKEYKHQAMSLKSIIKTETSPVLKKKVSFKRKSRQEGSERIYEDVQINKETSMTSTEQSVKAHSVVIPLESFHSMSVDEEKSYLEKQTITNTSLEDDYNKWSKSNDHEYEPIDPPPEVITIKNPLIIHDNTLPPEKKVQISFKEELLNQEENNTTGKSLSIKELQKNMEDRYFHQSAEVPKSTDKGSSTLPTHTLKTESKGKAKTSSGKNFNKTLKMQADKIKSKMQSIKRPHFTLPKRPTFSTAKLKKPNFKMPKLSDGPTISLPSFNFSRKSSKDTWRERQFSTESNVGDSKKKIFDFRTYPRMFDRSRKKEKQESTKETSTLPPEFATMPRMHKIKQAENDDRQKKPDVIRIPLHPEDEVRENQEPDRVLQEIEIDNEIENGYQEEETEYKEDETECKENEDSVFGNDFLKRWEHGQFHENVDISSTENNHKDFDIEEYRNHENVKIQGDDSFDITPPKEHSSESLSEHRRGVLEEIDSDEFFLREKGISQEDIEVGKYLSSEIREAFRKPQFQSEDREYDMELSDQSEPIREAPRRKPLRKPKRKKTPHVSREQISFDRESYNTEPEDYIGTSAEPPVRPKRSSKKKKRSPTSDIIPYQETIPIHDQGNMFIQRSEILPDNILSNDIQFHYENEFPQLYENEHMKGIEQPEITVSHTYYRFQPYPDDQPPMPPTRRQRSLRSLSASDQDSLFEVDKISKDFPDEHISAYLVDEYIIPTPEPPVRPIRTRSRTRSQSAIKQEEQVETCSAKIESEEETSFIFDAELPIDQTEMVEILEEPCIRDVRDASGYAIIDKSKVKETPLPPSTFDDTPKTPPRRRRNKKNDADDKFATVPRLSGDSDPPRRPLRNYSTLRGTTNLLTDEEKENLNLSAGRLQSGEVIQKMRDRPLPAPPRPPRKSRSTLSDISHKQNIRDSQENINKLEADILLDIEDQIEAYDHEETITHGALVLQTIVDPNIVPYAEVSKTSKSDDVTHTERIIPITLEKKNTHEILEQHFDKHVEEILISHKENEEGDDFSVIPEEFNQLKSPEDIVEEKGAFHEKNLEYPEKITRVRPSEVVDELSDEDSAVPEEFHRLKDPVTTTDEEKISKCRSSEDVLDVQSENQHSVIDDREINVLKANKLQVCDLDVDKLRVKELQADKIVVSELDGVSLQVSEINSKCGNLIVSGIDLPPNLIQEMLHKLHLAATEQASSGLSPPETSQQLQEPAETTEEAGQKKTPNEELEEAPPIPPRYDSRTNLLDEVNEPPSTCDIQNQITEKLLEPPIRPPRRSSQVEKLSINTEAESISNTDEICTKEPVSIDTDVIIEQKDTEEPLTKANQPIERNEFHHVPLHITPKTDEEPPPRPPEPIVDDELSYAPSQPPPNFFSLKSPHLKEFFDEDIPLPPRRKRHHRPPPVSRSSSDDVTPPLRRHHRSHEQSIPQLTGQLVRLCAVESERSIKRLICHITNNILQNADGKQDLHVIILLLLILIAGLLLLSDPKITVHQNHWDFFNPPTDK